VDSHRYLLKPYIKNLFSFNLQGKNHRADGPPQNNNTAFQR
jgi:hypothetical protein